MAESVSVDVLAKVYGERDVSKLGDQFAKTAVTADAAAASLKVWNDVAAKSARADSTLVQSRNAHAKADKLLADAENVLAGKATQYTRLLADQRQKEDDAAKSAGGLAARFSALAGTGSIAGGGMGALYTAGVALSPIIATVGVGLGGLALAALATGKNSKILGQELAPLKGEFAGFQRALQPTVLADFAGAAKLAGGVLADVEPVAAATGKALGGVFAQVGAEFQSSQFQQLFQFMQRTAGPDIQLLGRNFVDLTATLPPLLEQLQPVATDLLSITDATAKLVGAAARADQSLTSTGTHMNTLQHITAGLRTLLFSPGAGLLAALKLLHLTGGDAGKGLGDTAAGALKAQPPVFNLGKAVAILNTGMTTLVGNLLTLQGDNLSWKQAMQAADAQLKSNSAGLSGNSKNALANKQAVLAATNAALTFASEQLSLHGDIAKATTTVQDQIKWLEGLHSQSSLVKQEIAALRKEEQLLAQQRVNQLIHVDASGQWAVVQGGGGRLFSGKPLATGGRVPGHGSGDTVPAMLTPGEAVVPKHLVPGVAPFLRANQVPGFATGGIVPSYSGAVGGVWPWIKANDKATIALIDQAVVKATLAGIKAAQSTAAIGALGGPTSASAAQAQAYARSRLGAYGWGSDQMSPLIALWNQESGWNRFARNPSGAYGIPQALPPGKMGAAANPPTSSAAAQINWGLGYIKGRYGSPSGAEAHELAFHWYDRGGLLKPGLTLAYNGTNRPEMVVPSRGGGTQQIVLRIEGGASNDAIVTRALLEILRKAVRTHGGGSAQATLGRA